MDSPASEDPGWIAPEIGEAWPRLFHLASGFPPKWWARHGFAPAHCMLIGVVGDAMAPTLPEGCLVMANRHRRRRGDGRIFALRTRDGLTVKRIVKDDQGKWLVVGDNPASTPRPWSSDVRVLGEVVWMEMAVR